MYRSNRSWVDPMNIAVNWGVVLLASAVSGLLGFYTARTQVWWRKTAMSVRILKPVLKYGSAVVIVLVLLGAASMRAAGWFG